MKIYCRCGGKGFIFNHSIYISWKKDVFVLKSEYLLGTYLEENEFKEIFQTHYKGKINKTFKKIVEKHGKDYELAKSKAKFFNHIKLIYKKIKEI